MSTAEILEAPGSKSVVLDRSSLSSQSLDLLREGHNRFPSMAPSQSSNSDNSDPAYIVMKDPYGNGGVDRPEYHIYHKKDGDPYGNGGVDRPEYDQGPRRKDVLLDGGAASGRAHSDNTNTGAFDDKLQTVDVQGLTDAQRDDAKSIGHAVLNGSEDDVRKIMDRYQNDPEGMAKVLEALNKSFDGKGLSFSADSNNNLGIEAQPLENQALNGVPKITVITGSRISSGEKDAQDATNWKAIQTVMHGNMAHTSLEIPPLTNQPEAPPNQVS